MQCFTKYLVKIKLKLIKKNTPVCFIKRKSIEIEKTSKKN